MSEDEDGGLLPAERGSILRLYPCTCSSRRYTLTTRRLPTITLDFLPSGQEEFMKNDITGLSSTALACNSRTLATLSFAAGAGAYLDRLPLLDPTSVSWRGLTLAVGFSYWLVRIPGVSYKRATARRRSRILGELCSNLSHAGRSFFDRACGRPPVPLLSSVPSIHTALNA